jgi:hypothetical protein
MYSHALIGMAEAAGFNNAGQYFKPLPMDWQPPAPPSSAPPLPPPQVLAAQIRAQVDKEVARIRAQAETAKSNVENLTAYLLGIREQDLEAALERLRIQRGTQHGAVNIDKVAGQ